jgi:signal peptidase
MDTKSTAAPGAWTTRRVLALLGTIFIWFAVAVDAWYLWPANLGGSTSFVIVSGSSMEPTYLSGDLVIARKLEPSIGDVIVYAPEGFGGAQIVHRIIGGNGEDGWIMQGDNNTFIDPFEPKAAEVKGVVMVHYSSLGRLTALLLSPLVWASVLLLAIVMLVWFSGDDCEDDEDEDDEDQDRVDATTDGDGDHELVQEVANGPPASVGVGSAVTRTMSVLAVAAMLVFGAGVTPAAASGLSVNTPGSAALMSNARCAAGTWGATVAGTPSAGNYTQVQLSAIPAGCQGLLATVYVHNAAGAVLATGTVTPAGATATVTTGSYSGAAVTSVFVKVRGWVLKTAWTGPPISSPAISCVAINNAGNATGAPCTVTFSTTYWNSGTPYHNLQISFAVSTNQNRYRVTINFADPSWPGGGFTPTYVGSSYNVINAPGYNCSSLPVHQSWKAAGNVSWENSGVIFASNSGSTNGTTPLCS